MDSGEPRLTDATASLRWEQSVFCPSGDACSMILVQCYVCKKFKDGCRPLLSPQRGRWRGDGWSPNHGDFSPFLIFVWQHLTCLLAPDRCASPTCLLNERKWFSKDPPRMRGIWLQVCCVWIPGIVLVPSTLYGIGTPSCFLSLSYLVLLYECIPYRFRHLNLAAIHVECWMLTLSKPFYKRGRVP